MRVLVGAMMHESNTFTHLRTSLEDFDVKLKWGVQESESWMRKTAAGGIIDTFSEHGLEVVPSIFAYALPSGIILESAYTFICDTLLQDLRAAMPLDGVCLALHGAMFVEGLSDPEGDLLTQVREVVGPDVPIACALDMHGNITPTMVRAVNAMTAYRTAPHTDKYETGVRAARLLIAQLESAKRLQTHLVRVPLVFSGEQSEMDAEPMKSILQRTLALEAQGAVLSLDTFIGYIWADSEHTSMTVIAVDTAENEQAAREAARQLAGFIWDRRHAFDYTTEALFIDEILELVHAKTARPLIIADAGDNPTAGAAENLTVLLQAFLKANVHNALFAVIVDPEAVEQCLRAREGEALELALGSLVPGPQSQPLHVQASLQLKEAGKKLAVVTLDGLTVVLAGQRMAVLDPSFFTALGLDLTSFGCLVLKSGYVSPEFQALSARTVLALTPGDTDLRIASLPFKKLYRPVYPLDPDTVWNVTSEGDST